MIRFSYFFNYPFTVMPDEGDAWFMGEHVPEVKKLPGIIRYRSWPLFQAGVPYPSPGATARFDQFYHRCDLCFENMEDWRKAYEENPDIWVPAKPGEPGFEEFECIYIKDEPEYNIMRDVPPQQYKYMMVPLNWPKGPPEIEECDEVIIGSYAIGPGTVSKRVFDDWYLGHHTREIHQMPGVSHYLTWKALQGFEPPTSFLNPNKFYRFTEVGMTRECQIKCTVDDETRLRYTWSSVAQPLGDLIGPWINMTMKFEEMREYI